MITLQTELGVALAKNRGHLSTLEELRGEMANTKKTMRGTESDRNRLRDEIENAKENLTKWEEKSRNATLVGEETIRLLQNDMLKEQNKTESIRNENQILSREKGELESRLGEAESILTKELEAKKTQDECTRLKRELEIQTLQQQFEEAHLNSTRLSDDVVRLESETNKQEYLRYVDGERIHRLKGELEEAVREKVEQTKKTRKLAKLLKRTMSSITRVYRMKMNIDMCYFDTITNQNREMPAKAEYSGPVVKSKPHGAGVLNFECGDMYLGSFENGTLFQY